MITIAYSELNGLEKLLKKLPKEALKPEKMLNILRLGSLPVANAIKARTPIAGQTIIRRTRSGKVAATYLPGNLRRSVKIFSAKDKEKPAVFVGFAAGEKNTNDGWYASIVENDTVKRETKRKQINRGRRKGSNMVKKGFDASKGQSETILTTLIGKEIETYWNNTSLK